MPTVVTRNQIAMRRRIRWKLKLSLSAKSNHHHNQQAASDTDSDQLDWDPEKLMKTAIPWWTKKGTLWYPYHGKDLWMRLKRVR